MRFRVITWIKWMRNLPQHITEIHMIAIRDIEVFLKILLKPA